MSKKKFLEMKFLNFSLRKSNMQKQNKGAENVKKEKKNVQENTNGLITNKKEKRISKKIIFQWFGETIE